jgi:hypothetical protein
VDLQALSRSLMPPKFEISWLPSGLFGKRVNCISTLRDTYFSVSDFCFQ